MIKYGRYKFPLAALTQQVTPNLEAIQKYNAGKQIGRNRIHTNSNIPLPDTIYGITDGHRLFINSANDKKIFFMWDWLSYAFSIVFLFVGFTALDVWPDVAIRELSIGAGLLAFGLIVTVRNKNLAFTKFIVFDRDTGLVLFPKVKRWPQLVVPFEKVDCYSDHFIGKGGAHFYALFYPCQREKGRKGYRKEMMLGDISSARQTTEQWNYINAFMDKTHPLPAKPQTSKNLIQFFKENNLTIEKMIQQYGEVIAVVSDKYDDILWEGNSTKLDPSRRFKQYHNNIDIRQ